MTAKASAAIRARWELLLVFSLFAIATFVRFANTIDDPLITLRYAANVLGGHGPVLNAGERVEGFTSPLHLGAAIAVHAVTKDHNLFLLKLVSVVFGLLLMHRSLLLVRRLGWPSWARALALTLIGGSWVLGQSASDALETTLAVWLLVWVLDLLVSGDAFLFPVRSGLVAGLASLARPEFALFIAALAATSLLLAREQPRWTRIRWALWGGGIVLVSEVLRVAYYGQLLPNTYYAKTGLPIPSFRAGVDYLHRGLNANLGLNQAPMPPVFVAIEILALTGASVATLSLLLGRKARPAVIYSLVLVAVDVAFILRSGGTSGGQPRFLAPLVVPLVIVIVTGALEIERRLAPDLRGRAKTYVFCIFAFAGLLPLAFNNRPAWDLGGSIDDASVIRHGGHPLSRVRAREVALASCARPGETLGTSEIGLMGYKRLDLRVVDMVGLADEAIARGEPNRRKYHSGVNDQRWYTTASPVGRELLRQHTDLIVTFYPPKYPILGDRYRLVDSFRQDGATVGAYARRGSSCDQTVSSKNDRDLRPGGARSGT